MGRVLQLVPRKHTFSLLYLASFFLSFHLFFVIYTNSSFLSLYIRETYVGAIYIVASILSIFALLYVTKILRILGNYKTLLLLVALEFLSFLGLAFLDNAFFILPLFVAYNVIFPVILLNFDVFLESFTTQENATGRIRGVLMTVVNLALVLAPLFAGLIVTETDFWKTYLISALFLIPFYFIVRKFKDFKDPQYHKIDIFGTLSCIKGRKNLYGIFMVQFIMRFFFSWMVIYMPIYLHTVIGFSWTEIGTMTAIILLPYVLFEYPAGRLADKYTGEKELLIFGFILAAFATAYASLITTNSFLIWTVVLFISRAGISLVEILSESYFFKHVDGSDNNTISFFRITRPAAYTIGPLIGTIVLAVLSLQMMWLILGLILLLGVAYTARIEDTK